MPIGITFLVTGVVAAVQRSNVVARDKVHVSISTAQSIPGKAPGGSVHTQSTSHLQNVSILHLRNASAAQSLKSLMHGKVTQANTSANGTHVPQKRTKVVDKGPASWNRTFVAKSCSSACIDCKLNPRATPASDAALGQDHYCCYQYYQAGECEASAMLAPKPGSTPCGGEQPNVNCLDGRYR